MKKILFITSVLPVPADAGGKIRTLNFIKNLSNYYEMEILVLLNNDNDEDRIKKNIDFFKEKKIKFEFIKKETGVQRRFFIPNNIKYFFSKTLIEKVNERINRDKFDIIFIDTIWISFIIEFIKEQNIVINLQNVEWLLLYRCIKLNENLKLIISRAIEIVKMFFYEKRIFKKVKKIIVCSEIDKKNYEKKMNIKSEIIVIPNSMDMSNIEYKYNESGIKKILFIGLLSYKPNKDSLIYFIEKIFPIIIKKFPEVIFDVVGKYDCCFESYLKNIKYKINYLGYVEDSASYFYNSSILVVPLLYGSGTRLKIIEAWARGIPVISTSIGAEGLNYEDNKNILIADTENLFIAQTIRLLNDYSLRKNLSVEGRRTAELFYNTKKIFDKNLMETIL